MSAIRAHILRIMLMVIVLWTFCMDGWEPVTHAAAPGTPAGTSVCGSITDSQWTVAGSPYLITCDSTLNSGSLTVDPGVIIKFRPGRSLDISGTLFAQGTQASPILFTSSLADSSAGDWEGLFFHSGSDGSVLSYAIVEYGSGILIDNASPFITYTTVRYHAGSGISLSNSSSTVSHSTVYSNTAISGAGINIQHGSVKLDSNSIRWNSATIYGGGINGFGSGTLTITNNDISDNSVDNYGGGGILMNSISGLIYHNTISRNRETSPTGDNCGGGLRISGILGPVVTLQDNTITFNSSINYTAGVCTDGFTTISGNLIANNHGGTFAGLRYTYPVGTHSPSTSAVTCNTIIGNSGLGIGNGVYTTVDSRFRRNTIGENGPQQFVNAGSNPVDATQNYWFTTDAEQIAGEISGTVSYSPFLSQRDPCSPPAVLLRYLPIILH